VCVYVCLFPGQFLRAIRELSAESVHVAPAHL